MPASQSLLFAARRGPRAASNLRHNLRHHLRALSTASTTSTAPSPAQRATSLLTTIQYTHPPSCPCHTNPNHHHNHKHTSSPTGPSQLDAINILSRGVNQTAGYSSSSTSTPPTQATNEPDTAFELASSSVRFGRGCTEEIGMDVYNILQQQELESSSAPSSSPPASNRPKRVLIVTDPTIQKLPVVQTVLQSLEKHCAAANIIWGVYSNVSVEPKDYSVREAIEYGRNFGAAEGAGDGVDLYVAVGGGSVMDTAKIVNLYGCYPEAGFLDFVNAPLGLGRPIDRKLKPLICVPTTAGTGSETTGTAIFDLVSKNAKTGISHRHLKPTLGLIDPLNTTTLPPSISISSGLDVLFHSLESYTAIPYHTRTPRPQNPLLRPAYQGANPISDIFSLHAMKMTVRNLPIIANSVHPSSPDVADAPEVAKAKEEMLLAATLAGIGFGNAGVHLCHGMSYPISGLNPGKYVHPFYPPGKPLIPHGVSVAVTAPAVFKFTAPSNPERHLEAAQIFGSDVSRARKEDAGEVLSDAIKKFLAGLGDQPRGLKGLGFERKDIPGLVEGTIPQRRVLQLAPGLEAEVGPRQTEELEGLFENAMTW